MKPWEGYLEPFKIFGNLYFVGTTFVSSHIIDTGDGLILIDSQYPQSLYLLLENIVDTYPFSLAIAFIPLRYSLTFGYPARYD